MKASPSGSVGNLGVACPEAHRTTAASDTSETIAARIVPHGMPRPEGAGSSASSSAASGAGPVTRVRGPATAGEARAAPRGPRADGGRPMVAIAGAAVVAAGEVVLEPGEQHDERVARPHLPQRELRLPGRPVR